MSNIGKVAHFGGTQFCEVFTIPKELLSLEYRARIPDVASIKTFTCRGIIPWKNGNVKVTLSLGDRERGERILSPVGVRSLDEWMKLGGFQGVIVAEVASVRKSRVQTLLDKARATNSLLCMFTERGDTLDELGVLLFGEQGWVQPIKEQCSPQKESPASSH